MIVGWYLPVNHQNYNAMPASVWIRCLQLLPYLRAQGIRCLVNEPETRADVCIFVRWQDEDAYQLARRLKQRGSQIIFDLCVNYFDETGLLDNNSGSTRERVVEAQRMVAVSDAIVCASTFIAERARTVHSNVFYLPDSIDRRHFKLTKPLKDFIKPTISAIWSGISTKAASLQEIYPLLAERGIALIIISDSPPPLAMPYQFVRWSYETFPRSILKGEICLGPPRDDNPYDRGHSHFKIGIFMAQGVPALASPLPSYVEVIEKTGGGKICDSAAAWGATLDEILSNRKTMAQWAQSASCGMEAYSTDAIAAKYKQLLESLHLAM